MASLASRMIWPASVSARTFTSSGRVYTFAKILDVLAADVATAQGAGLVLLGQSGATPQGLASQNAAGTTSQPPNNPPGGWAAFLAPVLAPDPNRPAASSVSAGVFYFDAALQKAVVSDGVGWYDPISGNIS